MGKYKNYGNSMERRSIVSIPSGKLLISPLQIGIYLACILFMLFSNVVYAADNCGAAGHRACCAFERLGARCDPGTIEVTGCTGDKCTCPDKTKTDIMCMKPPIVGDCGAAGQRACCAFERAGGRCNAGLIEVKGCSGDQCICPGGDRTEIMCIKPPTVGNCGGLGQRICCVGEKPTKGAGRCETGMIENEGCNGECTCPGGLPTSIMCTKAWNDADKKEPGTGLAGNDERPVTDTEKYDLRGYADLHLHLFSELAFGGDVISGKVYSDKGIADALSAQHDFKIHGTHGLDFPIAMGTQDMTANPDPGRTTVSIYGWPHFNGWPTWRSTVHQQAYYKWLKRAWQGGLRLVVMLAVTNEAFCKTTAKRAGAGKDCEDSMKSIDAQLDKAAEFETFIANNDGGWFKIVKSPAEARTAIKKGQLAVVLGIEVDNIFKCKKHADFCNDNYVSEQVDKYYKKGVRHIFPIHNFDNRFGGTATWQDMIEYGNNAVEGDWWVTENCPEVAIGGEKYLYGFNLRPVDFWLEVFKGITTSWPRPGHFEDKRGSCNTLGLTDTGKYLIKKLMSKGMIIDIDHMSNKSFDDTLKIAEASSPKYPVVASHVLFFKLHTEDVRHERMRTPQQVERIRNVGGMLAAMLKDDVQDTNNIGKKKTIAYGKDINDDCIHSTKTFAQSLKYAMDTMGAPGEPASVAFGSDFNGIAGHVGPRFGSDGCGRKGEDPSTARLTYPITVEGFGKFNRQKTGQRTFDFNVDGLAHVGLLPDLTADLKTVGLRNNYMEKLFHSAEEYIKLWERAECSADPAKCPSSK